MDDLEKINKELKTYGLVASTAEFGIGFDLYEAKLELVKTELSEDDLLELIKRGHDLGVADRDALMANLGKE
ncbi:MAG: hypothetical protein KZQ83_00505 [gamma proteobacterium symbiont of Taylorina sp.]|nr:hypothetical protein [gamma proteobacterium symbiont of Taylorina sp.]